MKSLVHLKTLRTKAQGFFVVRKATHRPGENNVNLYLCKFFCIFRQEKMRQPRIVMDRKLHFICNAALQGRASTAIVPVRDGRLAACS
jgi:hypothetical protein